MQKIVKKEFNKWYERIEKDKYYLVLTNDMDSYLSCLYLNKKFGVEIGGYYDFNTLYLNEKSNEKEPIWVDCDVVNGLAIGNHSTPINNPKAINLNKNIDRWNYTDKYAGSTLFTLFSLYDEDLSSLSVNQIKLLLCVDSWFLQYFKFNEKWNMWLEYMEMEYLNEVLKNSHIEQFENCCDWFGINKGFTINSYGKLDIPIDLDKINRLFNVNIPKLQLTFPIKSMEFKTRNDDYEIFSTDPYKVFSSVRTYRNKVRYSYF